jgi:predicted nucleic acid-binding Zn ribbon protein
MSERKSSGPVSIGDVLAGVLARNGMDTRLSQVSAIDDWPAAVGAQIAQVTEPVSISADGVLWVRVTTAAWMNELSLLAPTLLARLNAVPGRPAVTQLRFRLGRR